MTERVGQAVGQPEGIGDRAEVQGVEHGRPGPARPPEAGQSLTVQGEGLAFTDVGQVGGSHASA